MCCYFNFVLCLCVHFYFLYIGEYNILLFLRLDSESDSAQTGALGSHGSSALSQRSSAMLLSLTDTVKEISPVPHWNAPEHIFPDKVQKDVELSLEALTEYYERVDIKES
ncbi:hypothetical protein Q5P01_002051 [Channa striata]|uniref:Uncharacterized protein n=1 Tax=Channa striata TaxID=64152 RepID=A0AA88T5T7_CHASR|nr:hypothetical protein Q5P01_002051 [Channa striata]